MTLVSRPIFIIGAPRSGTSVTTWALGQHPNLQPMPETSWIASMAVGSYLSYEKGSERGRFSHLSNVEFPLEPFMAGIGTGVHKVVCDVYEERCRRFYGDYRARGFIRINPEKPNRHMQIRRHVDDPKERWVDGTPLNTQFIWGLRLLFPEARFLHLVRRPENVATSLMNFENVGAISQSAKQALTTWTDHTHFAVLAQKAFGPEVVKSVSYEALIADTETVLADILDFLGEPPSADCLLPFGDRINSSQAEDQREQMADKVKSLRAFREAEELYDDARAPDMSEDSAKQALAELQHVFVDHCHTRKLL
jgi:hypothetical protein